MRALGEHLPAYVPRLLRSRLATDTAGGAFELRFEAAVVFADISGFTALAERLAREGPSGAEALSRVLNACFGRLVDVVAQHGGDVLKFAGDALLSIWRVPNGESRRGS